MYYDRAGYGSRQRTLKEAREKDKSMDLLFINDLEDQKLKVGMIMIDVFDKFMHVVAIKGKKEEDLARGVIECLHKMGKNLRCFILMMKARK